MAKERREERVAVLGGRGMLGTDVACELRTRNLVPLVYDLPEFDIRRPDDVDRALQGVTAVVNCAAYTDVNGAESHPGVAREVNAEAVGSLARLAATRGVHAVHISTDFVFDGCTTRPYHEDDEPRPLNVYGQTKLDGERAFLGSGCEGALVRVEWTYGQAGFTFVHKVVERARQGGEVRMVDDQIGSPTWTRDVAAALGDLLDHRAAGLFHYAATGYVSRFDIAGFILEELGMPRRLVRCRTEDFQSPAQRPLNSRFDCGKIDRLLAAPRPGWEASLRKFLGLLAKAESRR